MPGHDQHVVSALLLTLLAGLSTGIGSLLGLLNRSFRPRLLALSLSFSAGVMLFVSFVEIYPKAREAMTSSLGAAAGQAATLAAFFGGIALIALIDHSLPAHHLPWPRAGGLVIGAPEPSPGSEDARALIRTGLFTSVAVAIHNVPEGLATYMAAIANPRLGLSIALAIAIHNIPEGLAISAPVFHATGNRSQAFWLSFASGLAEPLGALVGVLLWRDSLNAVAFGVVFAAVAGIMIYICLDELLPTSRRHGAHGLMMAGVVAGMAVMALSLLLIG